MIIEYGVAYAHHFCGAPYTQMDDMRFSDYDKALEYASTFEDCEPTIYLIVDKKYVFDCERSKVKNCPYCIYNVEKIVGGIVKVSIWWHEFIKDYEKYLYLSVGELPISK